MRVQKPVDPTLLQQEMTVAGVPYRHLAAWQTEVPGEIDVVDHDQNGFPSEPVPEARPIIAAHVAPVPLVTLMRTQEQERTARTTNATPLEILRIPCKQKHVYRVSLSLIAVDAVSGVVKQGDARGVFKRLLAGPISLGPLVWDPNPPFQEAASTAWNVLPTFDDNDAILSVAGAAGRTIDWLLDAHIWTYAPQGLEAL